MSSGFRFGTVGSPISTPKKPGGSVGAVMQIATLGLNALELGWVQSVRVTEATCLAIRQTAMEHNVAISVHAPYFINLNANAEEWPKSRKRLMDAAYYGNLAGATDVVFHPGSYFNLPPAQALETAIPRLRECLDEVRNSGNPILLRPETMGKTALLGSLEDTLAISQSIPGIEPCLDFAHLHARAGDGKMNSIEEWVAQLSLYEETLGKSALQRLHIHMSGIDYTQKGEKKHLTLNESDFDLNALLSALTSKGCSGRLLCESPVMEMDALLMQNAWKEIISK